MDNSNNDDKLDNSVEDSDEQIDKDNNNLVENFKKLNIDDNHDLKYYIM